MQRGHLPYRGEPQPKVSKPRRQARNLRLEKSRSILTVGLWILLSISILGIALLIFYFTHNGDFLAVMIFVFIAFLTITIGVAVGLNTIDKFRKGYDIDISGETEKEDRGQPMDS